MKHMIIHTLLLAAIGVAMVAPPAGAEDRARGFYLGTRLTSSDLHTGENADGPLQIERGGRGLVLLAGYSFNRRFSLQLELLGAEHDTSNPSISLSYGNFAMLAHYRFRPDGNFRPYIKAGLAAYGLGFHGNGDRVTLGGGGLPVGGGLDYFFTTHFSMGIDFAHNIIEYTNVDVELDNSTVSFDIDAASRQTAFGLAFGFYF